jgi:hypothetical protein
MEAGWGGRRDEGEWIRWVGKKEGKGRRKNRIGKKRKIEKGKRGKGIIDISPSYPCYTTGRSCFAKRFPKTVSNSTKNLLHRHSHSWSCHNRSHSCAKRTLVLVLGIEVSYKHEGN